MSTDTNTDNIKSLNNIKKLENDGHNYSTWAICCRMVLIGLDLWDVINPAAQMSTCPTPPTAPATSGKAPSTSVPSAPTTSPDPITEWDWKNSKALVQISLIVEDTPLHIVNGKDTTKEVWQDLADYYYGAGAQDASILTSQLHQFQLDDSKPLEPQINLMHEMRCYGPCLGNRGLSLWERCHTGCYARGKEHGLLNVACES